MEAVLHPWSQGRQRNEKLNVWITRDLNLAVSLEQIRWLHALQSQPLRLNHFNDSGKVSKISECKDIPLIYLAAAGGLPVRVILIALTAVKCDQIHIDLLDNKRGLFVGLGSSLIILRHLFWIIIHLF